MPEKCDVKASSGFTDGDNMALLAIKNMVETDGNTSLTQPSNARKRFQRRRARRSSRRSSRARARARNSGDNYYPKTKIARPGSTTTTTTTTTTRSTSTTTSTTTMTSTTSCGPLVISRAVFGAFLDERAPGGVASLNFLQLYVSREINSSSRIRLESKIDGNVFRNVPFTLPTRTYEQGEHFTVGAAIFTAGFQLLYTNPIDIAIPSASAVINQLANVTILVDGEKVDEWLSRGTDSLGFFYTRTSVGPPGTYNATRFVSDSFELLSTPPLNISNSFCGE